MPQAIMNVRVDSDDKKSFDKFCNAVGMNVSVAVNMFVKAVIREQKLPFEIKTDEFDTNIEASVTEGRKIAKDKKIKGYKSMAALRKALDV